jgi:DNA ligase (NAD+)
MDIEGLGEAAVEQLVSLGLVNNYADLYSLYKQKERLIVIDRWGEKSTRNLLDAIERSKKQQFHRVLFALGIRHVGAGVAQVIAEHFPSIEALENATEDDLQAVSAIGPRIAGSIVHFFGEKHNRAIIGRLTHAGVKLNASSSSKRGKLAGMTFALTGTLPTYSREEAKRIIEEQGGKVASSVNKNVQYVLVGENAGSKLAKARQLSLKTLSEEEFIAMIR